jgi:transposase-like protein
MTKQTDFPRGLQQAIIYFADIDNCILFLSELRWPNGVSCPKCEGKELSYLTTRRLWKCKACKKQFSVKVGTIMEDSAIGLDKWLAAMWMIANMKNGVSSYEMAKSLLITQKSAWFMMHRIRLAMQTGTFMKLSGQVEADETFIGGKARNMHRSALAKRVAKFATPHTGRNQNIGKVAVMGLLERHGEVRTRVIGNTKRATLHKAVHNFVEPGSEVFTDALRSYYGLEANYIHQMIDHAERYVDGQIHTNGIENFWSLLKRSLKGTYVSVMPFHLFRYLDEQTFRFNSRKGTDAERFVKAAGAISGKRLTYAKLTSADD